MSLVLLLCELLSASAVFVNPPPAVRHTDMATNPVWTVGQDQVIAWQSDAPISNLSFWQQNLSIASARNGGDIFGSRGAHPP